MKTNIYIFSGIEGGGDKDDLVGFLIKKIKETIKNYKVFSFNFCDKDNYKEFDFDKAFDILKDKIIWNKELKKDNKNIFIGHSFSSLTLIYFLNENKDKYNFSETDLVLIDPSNSVEIVDYFDSLKLNINTKDKDYFLSDKTIKYMRLNNNIDIQRKLNLNIHNIDSKDLNSDHNFTNIKDKENLYKELSKYII